MSKPPISYDDKKKFSTWSGPHSNGGDSSGHASDLQIDISGNNSGRDNNRNNNEDNNNNNNSSSKNNNRGSRRYVSQEFTHFSPSTVTGRKTFFPQNSQNTTGNSAQLISFHQSGSPQQQQQQRSYHPVETLIDALNDRVVDEQLAKVNEQVAKSPRSSSPHGRRATDEIHDIEEITREILSDTRAEEPVLLRILKSFGWTGNKFKKPLLHTLKAQEQCLGALQNYYLRHQSDLFDDTGHLSMRSMESILMRKKQGTKLDYILPFCPETLLNYLEGQKINMLVKPSPVRSFSFKGACMLADISGFSKFSGSMCAKGVGGLDGLREATNVFLAHFVKVVYEHNGDVIAFAGDALICVFRNTVQDDPSKDEIEDCTFRAMQCGCILREYRTEQLSTHIGISYGELKVGLLGGFMDRWIFMLNGECVSELSSCVDEAKSGQLVVTSKCFKLAVLACNTMFDAEHDISASVAGAPLPDSADGNYIVHKVNECVPTSPVSSNKLMLEITASETVSALPPFSPGTLPPPRPSRSFLERKSSIRAGTNADNNKSIHSMNGGTDSGSGSFGIASASYQSFPTDSIDDGEGSISRMRAAGGSGAGIKAVPSMLSMNDKFSSIATFVPHPVLSAVYSETLDSIGELRKVTTMFLNLNSYNKKMHQDPVSLQPFFVMAQEALHESGGFLRQFLVDDKGCVLIAMWGTPAFTYANNCARALYSAVAIHQRALELDHHCSIGLTTGMVYCGIIGSPLRQDYVGIGNEVNLAARLMGKAKGKILVDYKTYQNLDSVTKENLKLLDYELTLKGIAQPVVPYTYASETLPSMNVVLEDDTASSSNAKLSHAVNLSPQDRRKLFDVVDFLSSNVINSGMGDEEEKGTMRDEIMVGRSGSVRYRCRALFVVGLPGTGKVALTNYFQDMCNQRSINFIHVRGASSMEGVPLAFVRDLFYQIVGKTQFRTVAQQRQKLSSWVLVAFSGRKTNLDLLQMIECLAEFIGVNIMEEDEEAVGQKSATNAAPAPAPAAAKKERRNQQEDMGLVAGTQNKTVLGIESPVNRRMLGEYAFAKVLGVLLNHMPTAIVISASHYCDESSWNAFYRIQKECTVNLTLVFTMRSNGHMYQRHGERSGDGGGNSGGGRGRGRAARGGRHKYERLDQLNNTKEDDTATERARSQPTTPTSMFKSIGKMKGSGGSSKNSSPRSGNDDNKRSPSQSPRSTPQPSNITTSLASRSSSPLAVPATDSTKTSMSPAAAAALNATSESGSEVGAASSDDQQINSTTLKTHSSAPLYAPVPVCEKIKIIENKIASSSSPHTSPRASSKKDGGGTVSRPSSNKALQESVTPTKEAPGPHSLSSSTDEAIVNRPLPATPMSTPPSRNGFVDTRAEDIQDAGSEDLLGRRALFRSQNVPAARGTDRRASGSNWKSPLSPAAAAGNNIFRDQQEPLQQQQQQQQQQPQDINSSKTNGTFLSRLSIGRATNSKTPRNSTQLASSSTDSIIMPTTGRDSSVSDTGSEASSVTSAGGGVNNTSSNVLAQLLGDDDTLPGDDDAQNVLEELYGVRFQIVPACLGILNNPLTTVIGTKGMDSLSVSTLLDYNKIQPTAARVSLVLMASSGSAFWCKEIIKFINEMGLEEVEKAFEEGNALEVMITLRFEKLKPQEQSTLRFASIIGDEFSEKMLASLLPFKKGQNITASLHKQLQVLVEKGFIVCLEESFNQTDSIYKFQNSLIQSTIYKMIPATDSGQTHHKIAEYMEVMYMDNLKPFYPRIGYHYSCSNNPDDKQWAFKYKLKAADQAISRGAYNEALELLEKASKVAVTVPELEILIEVCDIAIFDVKTTSCSMAENGDVDDGMMRASFDKLNKFSSKLSSYWSDNVASSETKPFKDIRKRVEEELQRKVKAQKVHAKAQKRAQDREKSGIKEKKNVSFKNGRGNGGNSYVIADDDGDASPLPEQALPSRPSLNWQASYATNKMRDLRDSGTIQDVHVEAKSGKCRPTWCC